MGGNLEANGKSKVNQKNLDASVIIAAHNEGRNIYGCVERLIAAGMNLEIIVVANGCTDDTAEVVRDISGVRLVEIDRPGKANALNVGDSIASAFPRVYLDADVEISAGDFSNLVLAARNQRRGILAVAPTPDYRIEGLAGGTRRFVRVHRQLMSSRRVLAGVGCYVLTREGRDRCFPLPELIADDGFVERSILQNEKIAIAASRSIVRWNGGTADFLRRRVRVRYGNRELDAWLGKRQAAKHTISEAFWKMRISHVDRLWYLGISGLERVLVAFYRGFPGRRRGGVLIVVQNLSVPLDRRVWMECLALRSAGVEVSVICPRDPGDRTIEKLDGVHIHRYKPFMSNGSVFGYLWEFAYSWVFTALLSIKVNYSHRFDVLQACNPPDTYWLLGVLWKLRGRVFVFDHHDLNPEVFLSRFGEPRGVVARIQLKLLHLLESLTFSSADFVLSTNESYREIAISRGSVDCKNVSVVRSGPDTSVMRPIANPVVVGIPTGTFIVAYVGIMGPQDGVDGLVRVADIIVHKLNRKNVHFVLMGFGDCLEDLRRDVRDRSLDSYVTFTGRVDRNAMANYLTKSHVGVCPDPRSPLNDVSTMNKIMEYMAYALPVVGYDLRESRVSLGDAGVLVEPGQEMALAESIVSLLDDDERRADLGMKARRRVEQSLDWKDQAAEYLAVMARFTAIGGARGGFSVDESEKLRSLDLSNDEDLRWFAAHRT